MCLLLFHFAIPILIRELPNAFQTGTAIYGDGIFRKKCNQILIWVQILTNFLHRGGISVSGKVDTSG